MMLYHIILYGAIPPELYRSCYTILSMHYIWCLYFIQRERENERVANGFITWWGEEGKCVGIYLQEKSNTCTQLKLESWILFILFVQLYTPPYQYKFTISIHFETLEILIKYNFIMLYNAVLKIFSLDKSLNIKLLFRK